MSKVQYYGIKYPFTAQSDENFLLDVNYDLKSKIRSILMHVIFTPKGQKLRDPEFGTNLVKYIFEQGDGFTFESVRDEVSVVVSRYIDGITINDISIMESNEDFHKIYVRLDYTVTSGFKTITDSIITQL